MDTETLKYQIALTLIPGIGSVLAKNLVSYCGGAEAVFRENKTKLTKIPGIGSVIADTVVAFNNFERAEAEVIFIQKHHIRPLFYTNSDYPSRLRHCPDSPVLLFYKGNADLNAAKVIAIVGTRNATEYGKKICEELVKGLSRNGALIVSGLAYGIDICAHKAALNNELPTVGILAHGLDKVYPSIHRSTAEKMQENGGLLTEYLSNTNPDAENFPKRNRIIAGLADAVVVIEAARKGGALITADIANSYDRDVFAVPGKLTDTYSEGCNHLIKTNRAMLIQSIADIEYIMRWDQQENKTRKDKQQPKLFPELAEEEQVLVNVLSESGKTDIDTLCLKARISQAKVASILLNLEFSGVVHSLPGKMYRLA